jgi:hypothetical protein
VTTGIVISAFALPIVLARSPYLVPVISMGAMWYVLGANIVVFLTIVGFFITFGGEDVDYSMW